MGPSFLLSSNHIVTPITNLYIWVVELENHIIKMSCRFVYLLEWTLRWSTTEINYNLSIYQRHSLFHRILYFCYNFCPKHIREMVWMMESQTSMTEWLNGKFTQMHYFFAYFTCIHFIWNLSSLELFFEPTWGFIFLLWSLRINWYIPYNDFGKYLIMFPLV
jgi:hypothetical protein